MDGGHLDDLTQPSRAGAGPLPGAGASSLLPAGPDEVGVVELVEDVEVAGLHPGERGGEVNVGLALHGVLTQVGVYRKAVAPGVEVEAGALPRHAGSHVDQAAVEQQLRHARSGAAKRLVAAPALPANAAVQPIDARGHKERVVFGHVVQRPVEGGTAVPRAGRVRVAGGVRDVFPDGSVGWDPAGDAHDPVHPAVGREGLRGTSCHRIHLTPPFRLARRSVGTSCQSACRGPTIRLQMLQNKYDSYRIKARKYPGA